jgi:hypothetical protein
VQRKPRRNSKCSSAHARRSRNSRLSNRDRTIPIVTNQMMVWMTPTRRHQMCRSVAELSRLVADHLDWFEAAEKRGMGWRDMSKALSAAGVTSERGEPLSIGTLSSAVWRNRAVTEKNSTRRSRAKPSPYSPGPASNSKSSPGMSREPEAFPRPYAAPNSKKRDKGQIGARLVNPLSAFGCIKSRIAGEPVICNADRRSRERVALQLNRSQTKNVQQSTRR